ncbi:lupeol synthase [Tanacetum coccineum]
MLRKENQIPEIPKAIKLEETEEVTKEAVTTTLRRAISFYSTIQAHDGHWPAESAGPLFFLPPLVIALYVTGAMNVVLTPAHQLEIKRYIYNHQNEDGRWGLQIEGHSTMFGSVLSYVTLRLLGEEADSGAEDMAVEDLYYPHPLVQDMVWGVLHNVAEPILTRWPFSMLREKALKVGMEHVHYEDQSSRYLCIGCVEKVLCLIATWVEDPNGDAYKRHLARIPDYLWVAEDGMKMQSFGSQMWDAAFAIQAIMSSNLGEVYGPNLRKAHDFVKSSQVRKNPPGDFKKMYRHISKGAWTFSMQDHGWQVSDCTAEGLKVALLYSQMSPELVGENFETEHLYDAVNVILSLQSENGGFPAWEPLSTSFLMKSWILRFTRLFWC